MKQTMQLFVANNLHLIDVEKNRPNTGGFSIFIQPHRPETSSLQKLVSDAKLHIRANQLLGYSCRVTASVIWVSFRRMVIFTWSPTWCFAISSRNAATV